jgi:translation initiation factor IF-3
MNEKIRAKEVRLIGKDGENIGIIETQKALKMAYDEDLDLVVISPNQAPPVAKILNYGKYKYELEKKAKEAKKKQHTVEIKEVQLTPQIGGHDMDTKARAAQKFLEAGNKVKVGVRFRGRQMTHIEVGQEVMDKFIALLSDYANIEKPSAMEGRWMYAILAPKKK